MGNEHIWSPVSFSDGSYLNQPPLSQPQSRPLLDPAPFDEHPSQLHADLRRGLRQESSV